MAGDVNLKIDADVSDYIAKVSRAGKATRGMAKDAAAIGDGFSGAILKLSVLQRAITAAGQSVTAILDKNRSASSRSGERALGLTTSLGSLGIKNASGAADQITGSAGLSTLEQRSSFAAALASASAARRTPFTEAQSMKALQAYTNLGDTTFGAGGSELLKGMDRGIGVDEITAGSVRKRGGLLDPYSEAGREMALKTGGETADLLEEQRLGGAGTLQRERDLAGRRATASYGPNGRIAQLADELIPSAIKEVGMKAKESLGLYTPEGASAGSSLRDALETNRLLRQTLTKPNLNTTAGE